MEFFSFPKYPHLVEVFDHGYCNDGCHVKCEVSECYFPVKGILVEETRNRAAVVHDGGDSRFRASYRLRHWAERVCKAIVKARQEREKAGYLDLSTGRWRKESELQYPDQVYPPHIAEKRRRALEATRMEKQFKFPSPAVENISTSLTLPSSKSPGASNASRSAAPSVKQHREEDDDWEIIESAPVEDDYVIVPGKTVI